MIPYLPGAKFKLILLSAMLSLAGHIHAADEVLFNNYGPRQWISMPASQGTAYASEFQTGNAATTLNSLAMYGYNYDPIAHSYSVSLWLGGDGRPFEFLTTFTPDSNTIEAASDGPTFGVITFTASEFSLASNTQYWLSVTLNEPNVGGGAAILTVGDDFSDEGSLFSVSTPPNMFFTPDAGETWYDTYGDFGPQNTMFLLNGTIAVPEPSTYAMMVAGVGMLLGLRRFRRERVS